MHRLSRKLAIVGYMQGMVRYGIHVPVTLAPSGIHDKKDRCHQGFKAFLWFIRTFKPKYMVHGHIHLYDLSDTRQSLWMGTSVINAYSHYVINTSDA